MKLICDFHIHSRYAYATSKDMNVAGIYHWAKLKGITIVGTGDCTHPSWLRELEQKLRPAIGGLWQVESSFAEKCNQELPLSCSKQDLCFVPTVEISTIYSRGGKVRKIHQIIVLPDFTTVHALNDILSTKGNLMADGRPTFGMDSRELLRIVRSISEEALFIPAHVWTPWFGIFGSKSGFDSLEEAFGEDQQYIVAIETGLSSDPAMNWQIDNLRKKTIVSFSDAHSPRKLGREATVLDCKLEYRDIIDSVISNDQRLLGTIEFFPEEGKYHLDGHRACGVSFSPKETARIEGICPVCGKQLTVGVLNRVQEVVRAQEKTAHSINKKQVEYIIPLAELLAAQAGLKNVQAKRIEEQYLQIVSAFGNEFFILRELPLEKLVHAGYDELAKNIDDMRKGKIKIIPGFDGEYGKIQLAVAPTLSDEQQLQLDF